MDKIRKKKDYCVSTELERIVPVHVESSDVAWVMTHKNQDCLTSLVSYVPDLKFALDNSSASAKNQFGISAACQVDQLTSLASLPLETVSARVICNHGSVPYSRTQPVRSVLKNGLLTGPCGGVKEKLKNTTKKCEEKQISIPRRLTEVEVKAEKFKPPPARLLQKKKTVAFGRTVNVSQTIEGTSKTHRKSLAVSNFRKDRSRKMAVEEQSGHVLDELEKLKEKMCEMQLKIDELTLKDSERCNQFLQLTETMKKMLGDVAQFNVLYDSNGKDSEQCEKKVKEEVHCQGKENIPPGRKSIASVLSKDDRKWAVMKRKYAENEEFKRLVDEAIMKYGGDESLDIFASEQNKGDIDRVRSRQREKKPHPISPLIRSTTRVTKQMTVEQIQRCESSPASCAFSYDSKKYLARHGIIPALSDDDEVEHKTARGKPLDPSISNYYPGNSVTYYSKNIKCGSMPLKNERYLDLSKNNHSPRGDYQEGRGPYDGKRSLRAVFDGRNYQMDQFDTDDDENVNDVIEINDADSEAEDYCASGVKKRSPHDKREWEGPVRSDFRYQKNDDMCNYTKQRFNKSAWD
uniref:Uncharacterized protein n=1 Tax=Setaria digitata TaxID=48799 RepID=A0A915PYC1_9BILA